MRLHGWVFENCEGSFAAATRKFASYWNGDRIKYSTGSKRYSLHSLVLRVVWPAWKSYVQSVPDPQRRLLRRFSLNWKDFEQSAREFASLEQKLFSAKPVLHGRQFGATIGTMRLILDRCAHIGKMKDANPSDVYHHSQFREYCSGKGDDDEKCMQPTEYIAYLRGLPLSGKATLEKKRLDPYLCTRHSYALTPIEKKSGSKDNRAKDSSTGMHSCLCRCCGRLTERDALLSARGSDGPVSVNEKTRRSSYSYCVEHRPPQLGRLNAEYRWSLRHNEEYLDLRARLQKQSHNNQSLKHIHPNPAVNWFENRLVCEIDAMSIDDTDPRSYADSEAAKAIALIAPRLETSGFDSVFAYIVELSEKRSIEAPPTMDAAHTSPCPLIDDAWMNNPSLVKEIAVLILYSQGVEQQPIAERLCLPKPFIARAIRRIAPKLQPVEDDVNISRAAYDLIQSKMTDRKKEIVALLSSVRNQSEVARTMGIARQEVSRALKSIPPAYRYDKQAR